MLKAQKGFAILELALVLLVVGLVVGIGWLLVSKHHSNVTKPAPKEWLAYNSTANTVSFSYPQSWHVNHLSSANSSNNTLEDVILNGPNGFSMEFTSGTRPTGPSIAACMAPPQETDLPINKEFQAVISFYKDGSSAEIISLRGIGPTGLVSHNCRTYNAIASENGVFTFEGSYKSSSADYNLKNAATFSKLPEVRVARSIFTTLTTGPSGANSSSSSTSQCGCQEFGSCADISACEGQPSTKP